MVLMKWEIWSGRCLPHLAADCAQVGQISLFPTYVGKQSLSPSVPRPQAQLTPPLHVCIMPIEGYGGAIDIFRYKLWRCSVFR
jgi:hypothetical protein